MPTLRWHHYVVNETEVSPLPLRCRIAEFRKAKGWTQAQLGALVGVSGSFIGMCESNARRPNTELVWAIAEALGVEPGDLYDSEAPESATGA